MASTEEKEEKGEVFIGDSMVTKRIAPLDYSESVSDTVSFVEDWVADRTFNCTV